jgi:ABC-type transport system involved in multi-copper enzyme maturation permease subunit
VYGPQDEGSAGGITQMIKRGTIHFELSRLVSRTRWFVSRALTGLVGMVLIVLKTSLLESSRDS